MTLTRSQGKRIVLDGATVDSADALRTRLPVLAFTPDRLAVVKGPPAVRRSYLDRALGRIDPRVGSLPGEYGSALAQRNAALRRAAAGRGSLDAVGPWTAAVARLGAELDGARQRVVARLAPPFATVAVRLGLESAELAYEPSGLTEAGLAGRLSADLERGTTGAGPHLRDVSLAAAGRDLRAVGSQGEQRVAVLSLLLAEAEVIEELRREPPGPAPRRRAERARPDAPPGAPPGAPSRAGDSDGHGPPRVAGGRTGRGLGGRGDTRPRGGPMRRRRYDLPETLAPAVRSELTRLGASPDGLGGLLEVWPDAVGPAVAANAWPARVARDGTVIVHVSSSTWAFELTQLGGLLRERLGEHAVGGLKFVVGRLPERGPEEPAESPRERREPSEEHLRQAEAWTRGVGDPDLRKALARAAASALARGAGTP